MSFHVNAKRQVNGFVDDLLILPDFDDNTIQIDYRIDRVERPCLSFNDLLNDGVVNLRDERLRDISAIHLFEGRDDLTGCHALRVEKQDLVINRREATLVLFD
jgi:hypothetical protein